MKEIKIKHLLITLVVGLIIWFIPAPEGPGFEAIMFEPAVETSTGVTDQPEAPPPELLLSGTTGSDGMPTVGTTACEPPLEVAPPVLGSQFKDFSEPVDELEEAEGFELPTTVVAYMLNMAGGPVDRLASH